MYLISAYFDEHVTKGLQRLIDNIAKETGNTYMIENNVIASDNFKLQNKKT